MNPTHLLNALTAAQSGFHRAPSCPVSYSLLFLQWTGPWCTSRDEMNARWAYRYTHTVGCALTTEYGVMFYDCNAEVDDQPRGGWVPQTWWEADIQPRITETIRRADGGYFIRWACVVQPPLPKDDHAETH